MRKLLRISLILILIVTLSVLCCGQGLAALNGSGEGSDVSQKIDDILKARMETAGASTLQELVWVFADQAGSGEEWYVVSMRQRFPGQLDYSEYRKAYEAYANSGIKNATARLRAAITLKALGSSDPFIDRAADSSIGELGIMSWIYGLHLLNNGASSAKHSVQSVTDELLKLQLADGGWAVMGDGGDVDVTAMAMQALAPHMSEREDVRAAIERAAAKLAELQRENGTFISFGEANAESTAQVIMALSSIGIDCAKDERFIKDGKTILDVLDQFCLGGGKYAHSLGGSPNASAAMQALYSLVSYEMMLKDGGRYYIFGEFSEPSVPRPERPDPKPQPQPEPVPPQPAKNIRPLLYGITAAAAVIACIVLALLKKRSYKSYLFVVILAAVAALGITFINVQRPDDYYNNTADIEDPVRTYISIRCDTVAGEKDYIPKDGIILDKYEIIIDKGQSAYDQLIAAVKANSLKLDGSPGYIAGIENIYEFDFGDLSGWMFRVNGAFSDVGCGEKILQEGDYTEWLYTKDLGKDIGNEYNGGK